VEPSHGQVGSHLSHRIGVPPRDRSCDRNDAGLLLLHRLVQAVIRQPEPAQPEDPHPLPVVLELLRADLPEEIWTAPQNWPRWRHCFRTS
jgi:hypothetical protein